MHGSILRYRTPLLASALLCGSSLLAADTDYTNLDPKAITVKLPSELQFKGNGRGAEQIVLAGDPAKPGLYVLLIKWNPNSNSRPHFHPNDRFITVLSGTWWVASGRKYDLANMRPVPAGSFVTHFANEVHYDGAKDGEAILQIVGMGPATATPAEDKN
jgi:quercetin dioxygenase-like cupin family protein